MRILLNSCYATTNIYVVNIYERYEVNMSFY